MGSTIPWVRDRGEVAARTERDEHAERRLITCVFVDVVGSTDATVRIGPERMKRSLDQIFTRIRAIAESQGGTVEKYIGDAIFILFGAPTGHADDASRSLRAAIEIVGSTTASGTESLSVRIGIETGEALVDLHAASVDRQRMAVGACVNIAARLQSLAEPGTVLVGPIARAAAGAAFTYEDTGARELKGIGVVQTARLIGLRPVAESRAPFVGRGNEMSLLAAAFIRASSGRTTLALVTAPPGQGKSRLISEFLATMAGRAVVLEARCRPGSETGAANPLRQLLTSALPSTADAEVIPALAASMDGGAEAVTAATAVAHSAGSASDPRLLGLSRVEREARFVEGWTCFLAASGSPTILQIEDLHWADLQLLRFIDRLAEQEVPVMLLTTTRPELAGRVNWRQGDDRVVIELGPLSDTDAKAIVDARRSSDTAAIARSGGNPLFLLELIDAMTAGSASGLPISLEAAIGARLDELASDERQLIQRASVAGETFTVLDAALLGEREPAEVAAVLGRLSQLRFLDQVGGDFRFYHPLAHDVAYNRLPVAERMQLHARYADEGVVSGDIESLAHHWWEGLRPPDGAWVWEGDDRLPRMLSNGSRLQLAAGSRYSDRAAHERAIIVLERGLTLAASVEDAAAAHEALARAHARNGDGNLAWDARLRAIAAHDSRGGDAPASSYADLLELTAFHWGYFHTLPDERTVRDLAERGRAAAARQGDQVSGARLAMQLGMFRPDLAQPDALVEEVISAQDPLLSADLLQRLALAQMQRGQIRLAVATYARADAQVAHGAKINAVERSWWGGLNAYAAGDLEDLARHAERLTAVTDGQSVHVQGHALGLTARLLLAQGRWVELAAVGEAVSGLVRDNPKAAFCIGPAGGAAFGAIAKLMCGEPLDVALRAVVARLVPESTTVQDATLMLPMALAGDPGFYSLSRDAYALNRVWDREITDPTWTGLAMALALAGDQPALDRELERLRSAEAAGGRLAGAVADALAGQRTGAAIQRAHAGLRALGYLGLSEIIARAPDSVKHAGK